MQLLFLPWELIREVFRHQGTVVDPYLAKLQELRPGTIAVALGITTPQRYPAVVQELAKELLNF